MSEFSLIERLQALNPVLRQDVLLGIGDDCALVQPHLKTTVAITTDSVIAGVHFPVATPADAIGYKALAVNLSDLAACGAEPAWATMALSMPKDDLNWLENFANGFFRLAREYNVQLIGGDTTQGPLSITVQACGLIPKGAAIRRSTAKPGDHIYVSGFLGDAGFELIQHQRGRRLDYPTPRVALGMALRHIATAAIDVSDGLMADLKHILTASQVGANLYVHKLPLSDYLLQHCEKATARLLALSAGDDYELCFTVPPDKIVSVARISSELGLALTEIGIITMNPGLRVLDENNQEIPVTKDGYKHFSEHN